MQSVEKAEEEYQLAEQKLKEAQQRVRQIKEVGYMESLSLALENLKTVIEQQETSEITVVSLMQAVKDLSAQVAAELTARVKQRAEESETLALINAYLKNWS